MSKFIVNIDDFINKQDKKIRQKVRNKAVRKAEKTLIMHGRKQEDHIHKKKIAYKERILH